VGIKSKADRDIDTDRRDHWHFVLEAFSTVRIAELSARAHA
jgi:hypothetical protein